MTLPIARVGQIEARTPEPTQAHIPTPTLAKTPYTVGATSRPPATAAEHLAVITTGIKVYDVSTGVSHRVDAPANIVTTPVTISAALKEAAEILYDYPGCSIKDLANYRVAKEGVPVRAVTRIDIWQAKHDLHAMVDQGIALTRYGENTPRYWLTEGGLSGLQR